MLAEILRLPQAWTRAPITPEHLRGCETSQISGCSSTSNPALAPPRSLVT